MFQGQEIFTPELCDPCDRADLEARERAAAEGRRQERIIIWSKMRMPYSTPETATVISKLPSSRSEKCFRWTYGPKGLFMWGQSGRGKTRTLVELLRRLWVNEGREFNFVRFVDWSAKLDQAPKFGSGMHSKEVKPLIDPPILGIDDCLKGRPSEGVVTALFNVIDARVSAGKPTFITTRYALSHFPGSPFEARMAVGQPEVARDLSRRLAEFSFNCPFDT